MIAAIFGLATLLSDTVSVSMSGYGPQNDLLVAKPTLAWQVWPEGENLVSSASITVDGKKQKATYSKLAKSLLYVPSEPFKEGEHQVIAQVMVNGWAKFEKKWSFRVLPNAYVDLPAPSEASEAVVESFNDIRKAAQLEPAVIDPRLCLSATGHAAYLEKNPGSGHYQSAGNSGFIGREPADRMSRMGFSSGSWEVLVPSVDDVDLAVKRLFDAPYHRSSMLNAGPIKVGGGYIGGSLVIDGELSNEPRTVVSPADGQAGVQPFWKDSEVPDPFRLHPGASRLVGYPIMFSRQGCQRIDVSKFQVLGPDGSEVEVLKNVPDQDQHLHGEAFVMPIRPLESGATYRVVVEAKDDKGNQVGKTWSFTTAVAQYSARTVASRRDARGIDQARPLTLRRRR